MVILNDISFIMFNNSCLIIFNNYIQFKVILVYIFNIKKYFNIVLFSFYFDFH